MTENSAGAPPVDGRQSPAALDIARGLRRCLRFRGVSTLTELTLANGRRADVVALAPDGTISIFEIKSSLADFRADSKWEDYLGFCDRFYFAVGPSFPLSVLPMNVGLAVADAYGAEVMREAQERRMAASTRKSVLVRFAAAAADRLHDLFDPDARAPF